jgi:hypothetical protein
VSVKFHSCLTSALDVEVSGQLHAPTFINPKENYLIYPMVSRLDVPGILVAYRKMPVSISIYKLMPCLAEETKDQGALRQLV